MSIRVDITPGTDPLGTILAQLDDQDYESVIFRVELNGTGSWQVVIPSDNAKVTAANFAYGNYVRAWDTVLGEYIAGGFMGKGDFVAVSAREEAARDLTFGGPGSLAYVGNAVWLHAPYVASGEGVYNGPRDDRLWHWFQDQYGDILKRALDEAQDPDRPGDPIPDLTYDFTSTTDSASAAWESFTDDDYTIPVGQNYLESVASWMRLGLTIWCRPSLLFQAYQNEVGTDRSSATFAAGKVRFARGANIGSDPELKRAIVESARVKYLLVAGEGVIPPDMFILTDSGAPLEREGFLSIGGTADPAVLTDLGNADLELRAAKSDTAIFTVPYGDDELNGFYQPGWPGGSGHVWLGDTVRLHTGTTPYDFNESNQRIAAITWLQRKGGDLDITYEVGATYSQISQPVIPGLGSPVTGQCTCCPHGPSGPYETGTPEVVDWSWSYDTNKNDDQTDTLYSGGNYDTWGNPGGSVWIGVSTSSGYLGYLDSSGEATISPGTYHFRIDVWNNSPTGNPDGIKVWVVGHNSSHGDTVLHTSPFIAAADHQWETYEADIVFPAGTTHFGWGTYPYKGHAADNIALSHGGDSDTFGGDPGPPAADDGVGSHGTPGCMFAYWDHKHAAQVAGATQISDVGGYFEPASNVEDALQLIGPHLSWKPPVRVATTSAGTLASSFENGDSVDGVTLATGDRILIKNQASGAENGIYVVAASGAPTRATDFDIGTEAVGAVAFVSEGTANGNKVFVCTTNAPITLGSTSLTFAEMSGGVTDHGALSGLSDDDHPQYLTAAELPGALSSRAVATGDLTVTGTAQDVSGATLSLDEGTWIIVGVFDVKVNTANTDRTFEGILDVGGSDEADFAIMSLAAGAVGDRTPVLQVWRVALGSTTTCKLQARYSGGATGDFVVEADHTAIVAFRAGGDTELAGPTPRALPVGFDNSAAFATALNLAANGGSLAFAVVVPGPMRLEQVRFRNTDTTSAREWGWDLYEQVGETNVLTRVAASNGSEAYTASGTSIRTLAAASAPVVLDPGVYWLVIQNRHASNTLGVGTTAASGIHGTAAQTKTTTNPNGSTLDFTAATWTSQTAGVGAVMDGRVFGQTTAFP